MADSSYKELVQSKIAFKGKKAALISENRDYAGNKWIEVKNANRIHFTGWVKNPEEFLLCVSNDEDEYFGALSSEIVESKNGWDRVELYAEIPSRLENKKLLSFIWKVNKNRAYLDDVKIVLTREEIAE